MTKEEEYRNADVPMPDDRGDLDLTKIIDIQNKELKDLVHDNTILLEEVKRLVKKINELTKPKIEIKMSRRKEKGRRWDGRSRIPTDSYKHNYNEIFGNKKKTKKK